MSYTVVGSKQGQLPEDTYVFKLWLGVSKGMLPVKHLLPDISVLQGACLQTVVGSKQGHAPCNSLLVMTVVGSKHMLPVRHLCLQTVVGSKQGHAPCKTLLSSNCGRDLCSL